jgi:hypothetical protein
MSYYDLISCYVQCCTDGTATFGECGPLWQIGLIGTFLLGSILLLLIAHFDAASHPASRQ